MKLRNFIGAAVIAMVGCGDDPAAPSICEVSVGPTEATLTAVGETATLVAAVAGGGCSGAATSWSSSALNIVTVEAVTGANMAVVTAVGNGTAVITASSGGSSGTATVTVDQAIFSVVVTTGDQDVSVGSTQQFEAEGRDANDNAVPGTSVVWSSSNDAVASIDASTGLATTQSLGTVTITATVGTISGSANLNVTAAGRLYFSQDSNGNGLFELDLLTGTASLVGAGISGVTNATVGLSETSAVAVLIGSTWSDIAIINADGSGASVLPGSVGAEALAMDIQTGILYGGINGQFFTVDPVTGLNTGALAAPGTDIEGLAADPTTGAIYGLSRDDMLLYLYTVATDSWSVIGDTQQSWLDTGLAYDHFDMVLYAIDDTSDSLYRIDPATASTTLVGPLGTQASGGLAFVVN